MEGLGIILVVLLLLMIVVVAFAYFSLYANVQVGDKSISVNGSKIGQDLSGLKNISLTIRGDE